MYGDMYTVIFVGDKNRWPVFSEVLESSGCRIEIVKGDVREYLEKKTATDKAIFAAIDLSENPEKKIPEAQTFIKPPYKICTVGLIYSSQSPLVPLLMQKGIVDIIRAPVNEEQVKFIFAKSIISRILDDLNFVYLYPTDGSKISRRKITKYSTEKLISNLPLEEIVSLKLKELLEKKEINKISGLYNLVMNSVEKTLIKIILEKNEGNLVKSSLILGISRNTISQRIKKYGLKKD